MAIRSLDRLDLYKNRNTSVRFSANLKKSKKFLNSLLKFGKNAKNLIWPKEYVHIFFNNTPSFKDLKTIKKYSSNGKIGKACMLKEIPTDRTKIFTIETTKSQKLLKALRDLGLPVFKSGEVKVKKLRMSA